MVHSETEYQQKAVNLILDAYERTNTYRGRSKVSQNISVTPERIFPEYYSDHANIRELETFTRAMEDLAARTALTIVYRDRYQKAEIRKLTVPASAIEPDFYQMAGRIPKREKHRQQAEWYRKWLETEADSPGRIRESRNTGHGDILRAYLEDQMQRLSEDKDAWYETDTAQDVIRTVVFILGNQQDILYRELSITLFGDTKYLERHNLLEKALRVLEQFGYYDFRPEDFGDSREYDAAVLSEFNVYENQTYVNFDGDGEIDFRNGTRILLQEGVPVAIRSDTLTQIAGIHVRADTFLTVENLASYNRLAMTRNHMFLVYLAGYHNHARQQFLQRVQEDNPQILHWYHFGDIDPDGFDILENLRNRTGIDFMPWHMGIPELEQYRTYWKRIGDNDRTKAENLIARGRYTAVMQYLLEHDCKLEQEIISWRMEQA